MSTQDKFWLTWWSLVSVFIFYAWGVHQVQLQQHKHHQDWDFSLLVTFKEVRPHLICRCQHSRKVTQSILQFCKRTQPWAYQQPAEFEQKLQQQHQYLMDEMDELESRPIPKTCLAGKENLKAAFRRDHESLDFVQMGYYSTEMNQRVEFFTIARQEAEKARQLSEMGSRQIETVIDQNRTNRQRVATDWTDSRMGASCNCDPRYRPGLFGGPRRVARAAIH